MRFLLVVAIGFPVLFFADLANAWGLGDYRIALGDEYYVLVGSGEPYIALKVYENSYDPVVEDIASYGKARHLVCGQLKSGDYFIHDLNSQQTKTYDNRAEYEDVINAADLSPPILKIPAYEDSEDAKENDDVGYEFSLSGVLLALLKPLLFIVLIVMIIYWLGRRYG